MNAQKKTATTVNINKEFMIVFTANKRHFIGRYLRVAVSMNTLASLIGKENANKALTGRLNCKADKYTKRYRKFGRVEIYLK